MENSFQCEEFRKKIIDLVKSDERSDSGSLLHENELNEESLEAEVGDETFELEADEICPRLQFNEDIVYLNRRQLDANILKRLTRT